MNDSEPPAIEIIHPSRDTAIMTDTVCIFKATFRDNRSLSSYSIKIWNALLEAETDTFTRLHTVFDENDPRYPKKDENGVFINDSVLFNKAFQSNSIFLDTTEFTVTVHTGYWIDSMAGNLPHSLGKHWFKVTLMDKAGNYSADSFQINVKKYVKPEDRE